MNKFVRKIEINEKILSLQREEQLFCQLFNKYNWVSLPNVHPLTTYRSILNPNELNKEYELIEIDKYLINQIKQGNQNRVWFGSSWVVGITNWLKKTKRGSTSKELTPIDELVPKVQELSTEEKSKVELKRYSSKPLTKKEKEIVNFIIGNNNRRDFGILTGDRDFVLSRIKKSQDKINPKELISKLINDSNRWDLLIAHMVEVWINGLEVIVFDDDYERQEEKEEEINNVIQFAPFNENLRKSLVFDPDKHVSLKELRMIIKKHREMK